MKQLSASRMRSLSLQRLLLVVVALAASRTCTTTAMPTILLPSGESHCIELEAAQDTMLNVHYEAPDLHEEGNEDFASAQLTIMVTAADNRILSGGGLHAAPVRQHLRPTKEKINQPQGRVQHKMEIDGTATLCVMAPTTHERNRRHERFYRFGVRVLTGDEEEEEKAAEEKDTPDVDAHLTQMEREMSRIQRAMKNLIREADFAKDRDAAMHKQFLALHSTTMYWPIVQVCVLLVTGFTQASHIVRFFQSRRII